MTTASTPAFTASAAPAGTRKGFTVWAYEVTADGQTVATRKSTHRYAAVTAFANGAKPVFHIEASAAVIAGGTRVPVSFIEPAAETEEPPAPAKRQGRKSKAEREAAEAILREAAAGEALGFAPATEEEIEEAAGALVPSLEDLAAASERAAEKAAKAAPAPKAEPKPVHPAGEVGSPEWKALLEKATALWAAGEKDAAAALLVEAHENGAPIKPLDTLARQGGTRGLAKAWWNAWKARPGYRGKDAREVATV